MTLISVIFVFFNDIRYTSISISSDPSILQSFDSGLHTSGVDPISLYASASNISIPYAPELYTDLLIEFPFS